MARVGGRWLRTRGAPAYTLGSMTMDLENLLRRNRRSLLAEPPALTPREKRAHDQFAREYAEQAGRTRAALRGPAE